MRRIRNLLRLFVALVVAVPVLFLAALGARFAGYSTQVIATGSMSPVASRGSVVLMRPLADDRVRVGDVVLIPRPPHDGRPVAPIMHRVVSIRRTDGTTTVETKGDANRTPDPDPFVIRQHTMTPVVIVPYLGFLFSALRTPQGWFLLAIVPVLLRTIVVVRRVWRAHDVVAPASLALLAADG
jgi:signal peptidase